MRVGSRETHTSKSEGKSWIPAFAGMTKYEGLRRDDERRPRRWVPAFAGMTILGNTRCRD